MMMEARPWVRDPSEVPRDHSGNATNTSKLVIPWNPNRQYLAIVNDSDTVIYVSLGIPAIANKGIRLNAQGGNFELDNKLQKMFKGDIYIIHGGAGNKAFTAQEISGR